MSSPTDLANAVSAMTAAATANSAAATALINAFQSYKTNAVPQAQLDSEVAALQAAATQIQAATASLTAAVTGP